MPGKANKRKAQGRADSRGKKGSYETPRVTRYGSFREITRASGAPTPIDATTRIRT